VETKSGFQRKLFPRLAILREVAEEVGVRINKNVVFESEDFRLGKTMADRILDDLFDAGPHWLKIYFKGEENHSQQASGACLGQTTPLNPPSCSSTGVLNQGDFNKSPSISVTENPPAVLQSTTDVILPSGTASNLDPPLMQFDGSIESGRL
jgi:hypothetical protein